MPCPITVHENVCVGARVTITPHVTSGPARTFCVGDPFIGACPGTPGTCGMPPVPCCTFNVSQRLCVQIPVTFDATAEAEPNGIVCTEGELDSCNVPGSCTHTIGFFRNHPDITNALITAAGGSIILGIDSQGLSITATTANANNILSLNPPPPAPTSPPFANQYAVLYAQLLAAQLNILNGADCPAVDAAIAAANAFIAASPSGGMAGAPDVQEPLATFNEGQLDECPPHCSDDNGDNGGTV